LLRRAEVENYCYVLNAVIPLKNFWVLPDAFVSKGEGPLHRKLSVLMARIVSLEDQVHIDFRKRAAEGRPWEVDEALCVERGEAAGRLCEVVYSMVGMIALRDLPDYDPLESQESLGRHLAHCSTHIHKMEADLEAFYVFPEERKHFVDFVIFCGKKPTGLAASSSVVIG